MIFDRIVEWLCSWVPHRTVTERAGAQGTVKVDEFAVERVREHVDDWDDLTRHERLEVLNSLEPDDSSESSNVICDEYWQHVVDLFDQSQTSSVKEISHFAVGDDNTSPSRSNTSLNNEVFRDTIDTEDDQGRDLVIQGFLDSNQGNGNTFVEAGLFTDTQGGSNEIIVNHALIKSADKTSNKLITITYTLEYRNA